MKFIKAYLNKEKKLSVNKADPVIVRINEILRAHEKHQINLHAQATDEKEFRAKIGVLLLGILQVDLNVHLVDLLLGTRLVNVDDLKNFINQTLLHFAVESNNFELCELLFFKYNANCLAEDNYRQTPLLIAIKKNYKKLFDLFVDRLIHHSNAEHFRKHIILAAYYSACCDSLETLKFLFEKFHITTNQLVDEINNLSNYGLLNPIHVSCYKGYHRIIEFFSLNLSSGVNKNEYFNVSLNEFRNSTPLEEAFKGFLMLDLNNELELLLYSNTKLREQIKVRNEKKRNFIKIINLLVENEARFSPNFLTNNGLVDLVSLVFSGVNRDADFVQLLYCIDYMFKFKLDEVFSNNDFATYTDELVQNDELESGLKLSTANSVSRNCSNSDKNSFNTSVNINYFLEKFLYKIYVACLKVLKDYKFICLNYFYNIVINLYMSGQFQLSQKCIENTFSYLKERNMNVYLELENFTQNEDSTGLICNNEGNSRVFSLKTICCIKIKQSIPSFGLHKVNSLNIPNMLKYDIFLNNCANLKSNFYLSRQSEFIKHLTSD